MSHPPSSIAPDDYEELSGLPLLFDSSTTRREIQVTINEDLVLEGDEVFSATLMGDPADSDILTVDPPMAQITILDNDRTFTCTKFEIC